MQFTSDIRRRTVGDLVAEDYRLGSVFKRYGIDFCCGGNRTLSEACNSRGVDLNEVVTAMAETVSGTVPRAQDDARTWPMDFLADYITHVHHRYVRQQMPILTQFADKVARVHGEAHPELHKVRDLVARLADELLDHLEDEENILFPYVKQLVVARTQAVRPTRPDFGSAKDPIAQMEHDHDEAGTIMKRLRTLTADYTPPMDACNTYRALFASLEQFEDDLHRHVHLENNVLFPRALALEAELSGAHA